MIGLVLVTCRGKSISNLYKKGPMLNDFVHFLPIWLRDVFFGLTSEAKPAKRAARGLWRGREKENSPSLASAPIVFQFASLATRHPPLAPEISCATPVESFLAGYVDSVIQTLGNSAFNGLGMV